MHIPITRLCATGDAQGLRRSKGHTGMYAALQYALPTAQGKRVCVQQKVDAVPKVSARCEGSTLHE